MPVDFSFLQNAAPQQPEQKTDTGLANVAIRVDADSFMKCDGEFVDVTLIGGQVSKIALPVGQHLLEFISMKDSKAKVDKMVDFPEPGKNYLVLVDELNAAIAPPIPQSPPQPKQPFNPYLDQLNQMRWNNPLAAPVPPPFPEESK